MAARISRARCLRLPSLPNLRFTANLPSSFLPPPSPPSPPSSLFFLSPLNEAMEVEECFGPLGQLAGMIVRSAGSMAVDTMYWMQAHMAQKVRYRIGCLPQ